MMTKVQKDLKRMAKFHKRARKALNHALTSFFNFQLDYKDISSICYGVCQQLLKFDKEHVNSINKKYSKAFKTDNLPKRTSISKMLGSIYTDNQPQNRDADIYELMIVTALVIGGFMIRYNLGPADWSIRAESKFHKLQKFQREFDPNESFTDAFCDRYYPYSILDAETTMDELFRCV